MTTEYTINDDFEAAMIAAVVADFEKDICGISLAAAWQKLKNLAVHPAEIVRLLEPGVVRSRLLRGSQVRDNIMRAAGGRAETVSPTDPKAKPEKPTKHATAIAAALAGIKTATALQTMTFTALKYIVPGLIVEGCVLLAGKPKAGKSWFSYDVALAVASGRFCLGDKKCEQGDVLYLALEDNNRRLQSRATKLLPTFAGIWPERFNTWWASAGRKPVPSPSSRPNRPRSPPGPTQSPSRWRRSDTSPRLPASTSRPPSAG